MVFYCSKETNRWECFLSARGRKTGRYILRVDPSNRGLLGTFKPTRNHLERARFEAAKRHSVEFDDQLEVRNEDDNQVGLYK